VAVGAEEVALGHLGVEDALDLVERGCLGAVLDEAADASFGARERLLSFQLGLGIAVVEVEGERRRVRDGATSIAYVRVQNAVLVENCKVNE
jgi:hypothetical protein